MAENIAAALHTASRLSCTAHISNTVLSTTLTNPSDEDMYDEEVTYFKQTDLQTHLKKNTRLVCI